MSRLAGRRAAIVTTLVVHARDWLRPLPRHRLEEGLRAATERGDPRLVHETPRRTAY